jgi:hypothetical protein
MNTSGLDNELQSANDLFDSNAGTITLRRPEYSEITVGDFKKLVGYLHDALEQHRQAIVNFERSQK